MNPLLRIPSIPIIPPIIQAPGPYRETCNDKYVVKYNFADIGLLPLSFYSTLVFVADRSQDPEQAVEELRTLLADLEDTGLQTEVRPGYDESLLIFVKAPRELLGNNVYKSRFVLLSSLPSLLTLFRPVLCSVPFTHPSGKGSRTGYMALYTTIPAARKTPSSTPTMRPRTSYLPTTSSTGPKSTVAPESPPASASGKTSRPSSRSTTSTPTRSSSPT